MDRDPSEARFCAECNRRHGAEEGDLWAESSMLGLRITYFAFMDGKVYDITGKVNMMQDGLLMIAVFSDAVIRNCFGFFITLEVHMGQCPYLCQEDF